MHSGKASTPASSLKSIALPSITGIAAWGPMLPRPSTAVPSETTATVWPGWSAPSRVSGSSCDRLRDARDAGRVGHREVVAGLDRDLADDLDLAALVHQERAVGDARGRSRRRARAPRRRRARRAAASTQATVTSRVTPRWSTRTRSIAPSIAPSVPIALATAANAPGRLAQLDAHREGVGGRGLKPCRRLQAGHSGSMERAVRFLCSCACARASPRSRTPSSRRSKTTANGANGCASARSGVSSSGRPSARHRHGTMRFFLLVLVLLGTAVSSRGRCSRRCTTCCSPQS